MTSILDKIVAAKRQEIEEAQSARPLTQLKSALADAPTVRDFRAALGAQRRIALVAEVKRASPSRGVIREDFDPVAIARTYEAHGAACVSVLTDEPFFQGRLDHLSEVRRAVAIPVLRKDFILEPYQVYEARVAGADAVLLIAECLKPEKLVGLHDLIVDLDMTPLVELYEPDNLEMVLAAGAKTVGVNNRDLRTFQADLAHTLELRRRVPTDVLLVAESGIGSRDDVVRLESAGVDAMLVGESLMASPDIGAAVDRLLGR